MGKKLIIKGADFSANAITGGPTNLVTTIKTGKYYNNSGALVDNASWEYCDPIDVTEYRGSILKLIAGLRNGLAAQCGYFDTSNMWHSLIATDLTYYSSTSQSATLVAGDIYWTVPSNAVSLCMCTQDTYTFRPMRVFVQTNPL